MAKKLLQTLVVAAALVLGGCQSEPYGPPTGAEKPSYLSDIVAGLTNQNLARAAAPPAPPGLTNALVQVKPQTVVRPTESRTNHVWVQVVYSADQSCRANELQSAPTPAGPWATEWTVSGTNAVWPNVLDLCGTNGAKFWRFVPVK